ncbi:hypothetical protein IPH19_03155 [Candidatus Uhrbacteria bacterium]|nr:MAG: hypothetical protein IPH19_03155 [Candidatus Uhrbacteria bacterium]
MTNDNSFSSVLDLCRTEIRVIEACDRVLEIRTPLPAKPRDEREAKRVLRDLRYVAWLLEGRRKTLLDGQAFERDYYAEMAALEKAKAKMAMAA